jgi:hypothetical protein
MFRFHTETNGWSDIAQHLSIAPDGTVWTGRDWNRTPASATGFSGGAFMFETIGDFDTGRETLEGAQRRAVVDVIALVQLKCALPIESLHFHREFTNAKTCPGTGIRKADILAEVRQARERVVSGTRAFVAAAPNASPLPMSRRMSIHAASAFGDGGGSRSVSARPFADSELASGGSATRAIDGDEGEIDCGASGARDVPLDGARARGLSADDLAALRPHVINLRQGQFSGGGVFETSKGDVDAIFAEHLPRALAEAKLRGEKLKVVVWAHGGLVSEESGLGMASAVVPWWMKNDVYPLFFVWETGLFETITQLIKGRRELGARDIFDVSDRPIEELVRGVGGGKIWDGMKQSAQRSVEPDGGARVVAEQLAEFCAAPDNKGHIELHAVGHSAGAIFHSHFIPTTLGFNNQPFATVSFLAPAIRVSEFLTRLAPHLGAGIDALTMFTMRKDLERADNCATLYRKSLLYLIHNALEGKRGEPILGLEESIRDNPQLVEIFGLSGHSTPHQVIFSKTPQNSGRSATRAKSHGSFDNDTATMGAVVRRILDVSDDVAVEPFPANTARAVSFDAALASGDFAPSSSTDNGSGETAFVPQRPAGSAPSATGAPSRLVRALCVGINEYPGNARLGGCVNDANEWAGLFRRLQFERVDLLLDQDATQARLRQELHDLVRAGRAGDVLVFQYSGHGTFFDDQQASGDEEDTKDEAIVPVDFPSGQFILDDELFEIFDELRDGVSLTCFFDCCHSGSMSRFALASMVREVRDLRDDDVKTRFIEPTAAMRTVYRQERGVRRAMGTRGLRSSESLKAVVFSACRDDEVALETGGRGVFTRRVAPMIAAAFETGTTNEEFQRRIVAAFGAGASQNPALDCASRALGRSLLRLGASHYSMEPGATEQVADESRQLLSRR